MKGRTIIKLSFVSIMILSFIFKDGIAEWETKRKIKQQDYNGVITKKYIIPKRRNACYIVIDNRVIINIYPSLYQDLKIGDYVTKKHNQLAHSVNRLDSNYVFYPVIFDRTVIE